LNLRVLWFVFLLLSRKPLQFHALTLVLVHLLSFGVLRQPVQCRLLDDESVFVNAQETKNPNNSQSCQQCTATAFDLMTTKLQMPHKLQMPQAFDHIEPALSG
jgi:hypothetical protein